MNRRKLLLPSDGEYLPAQGAPSRRRFVQDAAMLALAASPAAALAAKSTSEEVTFADGPGRW